MENHIKYLRVYFIIKQILQQIDNKMYPYLFDLIFNLYNIYIYRMQTKFGHTKLYKQIN